MAKRFGGKYSPDGQAPKGPRDSVQSDRQIAVSSGRVKLLYVPAVVLAATSLNEGPVTLVTALVGAAVLTLAAWLLQEGLEAEAAYNARKVARRPALPRKMLATVLTGVGVAIAAYTGDSGTVGSILYGIAAAGLHTATFGIDPMTDKRMEGVDTFQQDRVARVVDEAEAHLDVMKSQIEAVSDRRLTERVEDFQIIARRMIRTVEEDPRDLSGARKFLGVYLMGARDATVKFVDLYTRKKDADVRADYEALLDDLEQNFAARTDKMLLDDRSDVDIEIKVLRDRLQREGVSLKTKGND
ncbi:5-bromo-4-chloroindolyl phosphate hydrolysis family protein [Yoonia sp. F2084L]|uniref:5-bromo-4-chloroindolyl phosphate hydrolysis family protein n=1 Tax=Yoonia sp. F2084L TaxID=2926419 RepID=UPI001FF67A0B|nr:5-bromo-4-chloroindolyl phosphate hydrolysis family protein [Yoonia sp. F2084L]MCK0096408.1 5-bromo-4-chloroindolyl phosphate hydrolysis family protein [Yoonia sp. F2084L]